MIFNTTIMASVLRTDYGAQEWKEGGPGGVTAVSQVRDSGGSTGMGKE